MSSHISTFIPVILHHNSLSTNVALFTAGLRMSPSLLPTELSNVDPFASSPHLAPTYWDGSLFTLGPALPVTTRYVAIIVQSIFWCAFNASKGRFLLNTARVSSCRWIHLSCRSLLKPFFHRRGQIGLTRQLWEGAEIGG